MKRTEGRRYNSRWDAGTYIVLAVCVLPCLFPFLLGGGWIETVLCMLLPLLVIVFLMSTYYRIDGDKLIVYALFSSSFFPIDKISEVRPTKSLLASPATAFSHRIAIKFTDRKILKSSNITRSI